jgi:hypothetical protein
VVGTLPRRVERTAVAVDLTLRDAYRQLAAAGIGAVGQETSQRIRVGGLRGGRIEITRSAVRLFSYEIVTGVRLTGALRERGLSTLTVTGTGANGAISLRQSGTFSGVLGGVRLRYRPLPVGA